MSLIGSIQIENFRGVLARRTLALDGRSAIIVGENGAGKSSIVDAFEYHLTGKIGRLSGTATINKKLAIPHLQASGNPKITLTYQSRHTVTTSYPKYAPRIPAALRVWYRTAATRPFILRRSQILQFIEAKPAQRYQQVSQLIGISEIERIEKVWRDQVRRADGVIKNVLATVEQRQARLGELLGSPVFDSADCVRLVNQLLTQMQLQPITQRHELMQRQSTFAQRQLAQAGQATQVEVIHDLPALAYTIGTQIETASTHYRDLLKQLQAYWQASVTADAGELMPLLSAALEHAQQSHPTNCPICQQTLPRNWIQQLEGQLATLTQVQTARRTVIATQGSFETARRQLLDSLTQMKARLQVIRLHEYDAALDGALRVLDKLRDLTLGEPPTVAFERPDTGALRQLYQQTLPLLVADLNERVSAPTLNERQSAELQRVSTLPRIDEQWALLLRDEADLAHADRRLQHVQAVYDSLLAARKAGVSRLLQQMEADFRRFYTQLHPNEGYGAIRLGVIANRRGSLDLETQFFDQTAHPLNFLSEGHLDSLGLCIFLAFIKQFNGAFRLIVLDDVLTSVDATHRRRVIDLLATEFADYQLVLTTHNPEWGVELARSLPRSRLIEL